MRREGLIIKIIRMIRDPERELTERIYLGLTVISEITVFLALIGDILLQENPLEIAVIIVTFIFVPTIMWIGLKKNAIRLAKRITVIGLVFLINPALFFFGGGLRGGGYLWIIFTFAYVGLVLTGGWRTVMLLLIFLEAAICYTVSWYYPELVYKHSEEIFYPDTFLSLIIIGFICYFMTWLQNLLFMDENRRAQKAVEKAEELSRAQNRFFSSMSHEIRTPINSILGLNELILREQEISDEIVRDASGIQGSGKMLLALINDILDFSKIEAGSMDIVPVDYRIGDMLSEIVNMVWIRANDKGLKFHVSIDPKVPTVLYGDEVRIKQVLVNLINNAVKYTAEGSVELHIESELKNEKTVELSISVTDTGMGIKKEAIPYLFDAFKRLDEEKNRHIEGTGLGLSIVKQLVELMHGTITVNSIYGEGSTFTVVIEQGISDATQIGELNIHNQGASNRNAYESSFRAPEVRLLIVDDNEMNLEVESKLLSDTEMMIDKAISGKEALELTFKNRYDAILMDHLMPEMNGIECLEKLRNQVGGLNRATPVIVLTANAGSENRELYNRAGFDGYLVKPVSGEMLENILLKYLSPEKLTVNSNKMMNQSEEINASAGYSGKMPVIITSTSMCDLPRELIRKLRLPILPFRIRTEEGRFLDGIQMSTDELIRYINTGKDAASEPPKEADYTDFFASALKRAHHLIHIALTSDMSEDYRIASEAAKSFDNVTVINSECLSSATGILVLIAHKLAQMNLSVEDIVAELEVIKYRLRCSFVIDNTEYMKRKGLISPRMDSIAKSFNLHPCLQFKEDRSSIAGIWTGNRERYYRKYIERAFPVDVIPDPELVFITYADVPIDTLLWIKEEISRHAYFEHVLFKQASAAIASNCGPGTFGILYFVKSNKSYNLSTYLEDDTELSEETTMEKVEESAVEEVTTEDKEETADNGEGTTIEEENTEASEWYDHLEGIDGRTAIKNSGSEESFWSVLKLFYDSIDRKAEELEQLYRSEDLENYTIKIHALKSSARLIGASELAEAAQQLEDAGKAQDTGYIHEHQAAFLEAFRNYHKILAGLYGIEDAPEKPLADAFLMESVYEGLREAAEAMDCEMLEEVLREMDEYEIPQEEKEKYDSVSELASRYDYEGLLTILKQEG